MVWLSWMRCLIHRGVLSIHPSLLEKQTNNSCLHTDGKNILNTPWLKHFNADMIPLLPNKLPFFWQFHIIFGFIEKCQIYSICYFKMMSAETKWVTLTIHNRFVCCCFQLCNGQLRQRRLLRLTRKSKVFKTGLPKWIFDINKSLYKSK